MSRLNPLPDYPWPDLPQPQNNEEFTDPEKERYKTLLAAHTANVEKQLGKHYSDRQHDEAIEVINLNAEIAARVAEETREYERQVANDAFRNESLMTFYSAYIDVAKGAVDRQQKHGELIQAAAIAIGTLYTGMLAYIYVSADKATKQSADLGQLLPARAIIPTVFLGVSIVLAMAYVAFRMAVVETAESQPGEADILPRLEGERNRYVEWAVQPPGWRVRLVQLSIISLGFGVASMPLGFVKMSNGSAALMAGGSFALVLIVWVILSTNKKI
ncbi:MAG: hypothetical protein M9953_11085 [Thermomicrobiales bacterium]|nr:hypothetical protein [Thermomicrobiales bacterium]MCO5225871.1 hypothetical protein [Thermomicrobiales bacterium]